MRFHPLATPAALLLGTAAAQITSNSGGVPSTPIIIPIGNDPSLNPSSIGWTEGVCYIPLTSNVHPGDELLFEFGAHNVYQLPSKEHFDNCDFTNATLLAQVGESPYTYIIPEDSMGEVLYFACQVGDHCAGGTQKIQVGVSAFWGSSVGERAVPPSSFRIGLSHDECVEIQENQGAMSESDMMESGALQSVCSEPVLVDGAEPHTYYRTCLSGPATLTPGGVVNRLFVMQDPFPQDHRVVIGQRTFEFVSGDPDSNEGVTPVPVNQLYVHHLSGSVVFGQGSEGIRQTAPDAPFGKPYGLFSGEDGNTMVFHLIDLRQVEDWLGCIECRCPADQQAPGTYLDELTQTGNITGGVNCCSNCTDIEDNTIDYRMRYNITYRELQPEDEPVTDVMMLTADISPVAGGVLEHDVPSSAYLPEEHIGEDPHVQRLEIVKPFNEVFKEEFFQRPYAGPPTVKLLRCVAHLHVAAIEMWLEDANTGERLCDGQTVYGTDPETDEGFLTAVSVTEYDPPKEFPHDLMVRFVSEYNATYVHTGVMGYWFLFVGGENEVSYAETNTTVEFCAPATCDATLLPTMDLTPFIEQQQNSATEERRLQTQTECEDTLALSPACEFAGICDCENFVNAPESSGCNGFYTSAWGDIEVRSVCANYCGCEVTAAVEAAVGSTSNVTAPTTSTSDEDCVDSLSNHPSCTFGGLCDCETFVNAEESTGCGGVYSSPMGDVEINSVCSKYCDSCGVTAPSTTVDKECVDSLSTHPSCTFGGLCDCETFVNAEESTGCGGVYASPMGNVEINSVCNKYCGCDSGVEDGDTASTTGETDNESGSQGLPSAGGLFDQCVDTIEQHPACRFGGVCSCEEFVAAPESEGCGGVWKSEMGDTVINDVCANYCNACVDKTVEELFEEAYSEVITLTMQEHCVYATEECQKTLANLYSCSQEYPGIEDVDPMVKSFVVKHGEQLAIENAKLGTPSLHVGEEDPVIEACPIELEIEIGGGGLDGETPEDESSEEEISIPVEGESSTSAITWSMTLILMAIVPLFA